MLNLVGIDTTCFHFWSLEGASSMINYFKLFLPVGLSPNRGRKLFHLINEVQFSPFCYNMYSLMVTGGRLENELIF